METSKQTCLLPQLQAVLYKLPGRPPLVKTTSRQLIDYGDVEVVPVQNLCTYVQVSLVKECALHVCIREQ